MDEKTTTETHRLSFAQEQYRDRETEERDEMYTKQSALSSEGT